MDAAAQAYTIVDGHLAAGRADQAEAVARHMLDRHPRSELSHVALARVLEARGHGAEAMAHLRQTLAVAPELSQVRAWLAWLLWAHGHAHNAVQMAQMAVRAGTEVPEAFHVLAYHALQTQDPPAAASALATALALDPRHARTWSALGALHAQRGAHSEACQALENAVAVLPADSGLWVELLQHRLKEGIPQAAQDSVIRAVSACGRNAAVLAAVHEIRQMSTATQAPLAARVSAVRDALCLGQRDEALALLEGGRAPARPSRAWRFVRREYDVTEPGARPQEMLVDYTRLSREYPESWEPRYLLALLLLRPSSVHNPAQALAHAEEAWRMSGGHPAAGLAMVRACQLTRRAALAHAVAQQVRAQYPALAAALDQAMGQG